MMRVLHFIGGIMDESRNNTAPKIITIDRRLAAK